MPPWLFRVSIVGSALSAAVSAMALSAAALSAASLPVSKIEFAPAVIADLRDHYGMEETEVLRSAILTAVSHATAGVAVAPGLSVSVTVRDIAPSNPTRRQLADNRADAAGSRFVGGADLSGEVRDAQGHVVVSVMYRYYPSIAGSGAAGPDPWADARLAVDQFAVKLAAALRRISASASPPA